MTNLDKYKQCEQSYYLCKDDLKFFKNNLDKYRILYINEVIDAISTITGVPKSTILGSGKKMDYVNARVAIIKITYEHIKNHTLIGSALILKRASVSFHQKKELKYFPEIEEIIKKYHEK